MATSNTDKHIQVCHGDTSHAYGSHAENKAKPLIYKKGDTATPSEPRDRRHQHQAGTKMWRSLPPSTRRTAP